VNRRRQELHGWGRLAVPGREVRSENLAAVARGASLTRGLGRSYGDASLPPEGVHEVAGSALADRILAFDEEQGLLEAEAGLTLRELHRMFLPRCWAAPVSPGTQDVTLGGMVAADVHGKNHHRAGSIGRHVSRLLVQLADAQVVECTAEREEELFWATVGGMGLTGHILEVGLRLEKIPSPWIEAVAWRVPHVSELAEELREAGESWPFTAAWVDGLAPEERLGRGVLLCGRWADPAQAPARAPTPLRPLPVPGLPLPGALSNLLLNRATVGAFNRAYYYGRRRRFRGILHPEAFFYPLDRVALWSRLYGPRGMTQYQCVLPAEGGVKVVERFLRFLRSAGGFPFLVVLKDFGEQGQGFLSFPRPGFTLALDFPVSGRTSALVAALDDFILEAGGRVYLAKDAFTAPEAFAAMEGPRLDRFRKARRRWDPEGRLASRLSRRLGL
jgi:decaprenylphospho-beta-D-ribofuranose 2-oxidase